MEKRWGVTWISSLKALQASHQQPYDNYMHIVYFVPKYFWFLREIMILFFVEVVEWYSYIMQTSAFWVATMHVGVWCLIQYAYRCESHIFMSQHCCINDHIMHVLYGFVFLPITLYSSDRNVGIFLNNMITKHIHKESEFETKTLRSPFQITKVISVKKKIIYDWFDDFVVISLSILHLYQSIIQPKSPSACLWGSMAESSGALVTNPRPEFVSRVY